MNKLVELNNDIRELSAKLNKTLFAAKGGDELNICNLDRETISMLHGLRGQISGVQDAFNMNARNEDDYNNRKMLNYVWKTLRKVEPPKSIERIIKYCSKMDVIEFAEHMRNSADMYVNEESGSFLRTGSITFNYNCKKNNDVVEEQFTLNFFYRNCGVEQIFKIENGVITLVNEEQ